VSVGKLHLLAPSILLTYDATVDISVAVDWRSCWH